MEEAPPARPKRQPLPVALPRESVRFEPDTENCPDCGYPLRFLRDEITERLEYRPATFIVRRYVCPQYSCAACQGIHAQAQPAHLIENGRPEPGLLAQVVVAKYRDHLSLYRQQQIYARKWSDPGAQHAVRLGGTSGTGPVTVGRRAETGLTDVADSACR
ncbi:transposase [Xenorhabdus indica]|nr:transposase [Xenorhabdus indica]